MDTGDDFAPLARHTLGAAAIAAVLVAACYFWIDRPVAFFVSRAGLNQHEPIKWLTYLPPVVQSYAPLAIGILALRRARGPWTSWQRVLLVSLVSLIVADEFRTSLGLAAGRYWPETWFHINPALAERPGGPVLMARAYLNNPSLLGNDQYGFHPFAVPGDVGSFPSGHAMRIVSLAAVWWLAVPRSRWLCAVACPPLIASLVAMNYHFVGDVVAGCTLGGIVGVWAARLASVAAPRKLAA